MFVAVQQVSIRTIARAIVATVLTVMPGWAMAAAPHVAFDTDATAACVDITTSEQARQQPQQRLLQVDLRVSLLVDSGSEDDLKEVLVTIASPEGRARVVDFFPKTQLISDALGPIERQETTERQQAVDVTANLLPTIKAGPAEATAAPGVASHWNTKTTAQETYQRLPPKKLLRASGTVNGGHGVFFKLHPSTQESLQGTHLFRLVLAVPADFRFDRLSVSCQARGYNKVLFVRQEESAGQRQMMVGFYLDGDAAAARAAARLTDRYVTRDAARSGSSSATTPQLRTTLRPPVTALDYSPSDYRP